MLFLVIGVMLILVLGGERWQVRCVGGFQILQILTLDIYPFIIADVYSIQFTWNTLYSLSTLRYSLRPQVMGSGFLAVQYSAP